MDFKKKKFFRNTIRASKRLEEIWPWGYKTYFVLNSAEHKINPAHKC